jgi:hypothetical protein
VSQDPALDKSDDKLKIILMEEKLNFIKHNLYIKCSCKFLHHIF